MDADWTLQDTQLSGNCNWVMALKQYHCTPSYLVLTLLISIPFQKSKNMGKYTEHILLA